MVASNFLVIQYAFLFIFLREIIGSQIFIPETHIYCLVESQTLSQAAKAKRVLFQAVHQTFLFFSKLS